MKFDISLFLIFVVTFSLIYFIYRFLLNRLLPPSKSRTFLTWFIAILTTPIVIFFVLLYAITSSGQIDQREFSHDDWVKLPDKRNEMIESLRQTPLVGLTKSQISSLLGDPDELKDNEWIYYLGQANGFMNVDISILIITFMNDTVTTTLVRDT